MVCVRYVRLGFALDMYNSCCLCQFPFLLGTQRKPVFWWNMGLKGCTHRATEALLLYISMHLKGLSICRYTYLLRFLLLSIKKDKQNKLKWLRPRSNMRNISLSMGTFSYKR